MSPIHCPYCQFEMELQGAKPGRFSPPCPACKRRFTLVIPKEPDDVPSVAPLTVATKVMPAEAGKDAAATAPPPSVAARTLPPTSSGQDPSQPGNATTAVTPNELFGRLGGYEIREKIGEGGMGAVYLARQISLDRNVAIKVLSASLAAEPDFVSRFTREAYAAAQLTHHNVVQIHDIGVEQFEGAETNFFSMEFVNGQTLASLVKRVGKVEPEVAAGYIVQAARGLQFAHEHRLIHRDIKPDNLLLNDQGLLKVADLGLVKYLGAVSERKSSVRSAPSSVLVGTTQVSVSMGTPAYMPPEQFLDAAAADVRADVYSLGCTFYNLLTGRPPFAGRSTAELMNKHAKEDAVPPDRIVKDVPAKLSAIVMKMISKFPSDRYQTMAEVIASIEAWLGVESAKPFSPIENQVLVLEKAVEKFTQCKAAIWRKWLLVSFGLVSFATIVILALPTIGHPVIAAEIAVFVAAATVFYQIIYNVSRRTFLATKGRQLLFDIRLVDWLIYGFAVALFVFLTIAFRMQWILPVSSVAGAVAAAAFYFAVDRPLNRQREPVLQETEALLKDMRLHGLEENALRRFVAKYSGRHWEIFYEALFGYEAKLAARRWWGRGKRGEYRPRYAAWREPIIAWIERKMRARQADRELRLIAKLERKALAANGIKREAASEAAVKTAQRLVDRAMKLREAAVVDSKQMAAAGGGAPASTTARQARLFNGMLSAQETERDDPDEQIFEATPTPRDRKSYFARRYGSPQDYLFGRVMRLALGIFLLVGFALWWNQNSGAEALRQAAQMLASREDSTATANLKDISSAVQVVRDLNAPSQGAQRLQIPNVPQSICDVVGNWNAGLASACLILSALCAGRFLGPAVLIGSAIILLGDHSHLPILQAHPSAALPLGLAITALSLIFLRDIRND